MRVNAVFVKLVTESVALINGVKGEKKAHPAQGSVVWVILGVRGQSFSGIGHFAPVSRASLSR